MALGPEDNVKVTMVNKWSMGTDLSGKDTVDLIKMRKMTQV